MKLTHIRDLASLQQRILATPLRFLLIPLSWLYTAGVQLRNILYTRGVFKARRLPCRVLSVGNIVVGGTGKTPAIIAIAKHLQREGLRVAILLRGYKRRVREKVAIVSDGEKVCTSPVESGDEAYMMAKHLRNVPILVGKCRYSAGQVALERFKVDVLLLDDGFQHRQLARDVDILTISTTHPFGSPEKLLPAGPLREPLTALRRADLILLTHADVPNISAHTQKLVKPLAPNIPVLTSTHQPTHLYSLAVSGQQESLVAGENDSNRHNALSTADSRLLIANIKELQGKRVLAVCGIGNPDAFVATLTRCSVASVELLAFPDHHVYTETDKQQIETVFQETASDLIVTTQKDEQKLAGCRGEECNTRNGNVIQGMDLVYSQTKSGLFKDQIPSPLQKLPIVVLGIELVITEGDEKFNDVLLGSR